MVTKESRRMQSGFTLIEALIILAVIGILTALAVPSFSLLIERKNLEGAAEKMFADFQYAKSEALKRDAQVFISFDPDPGNACYGLALDPGCDCTGGGIDCVIDGVSKVVNISDYGATGFTQNFVDETSYDPRRGNIVNIGTVSFTSPSGMAIDVVLSRFRMKICSPMVGNIFTYDDCP